jgi:hypothetical protein
MPYANDIANLILAISAGIIAYAYATNNPEIVAYLVPIALGIKAIGSFISGHYQIPPIVAKEE